MQHAGLFFDVLEVFQALADFQAHLLNVTGQFLFSGFLSACLSQADNGGGFEVEHFVSGFQILKCSVLTQVFFSIGVNPLAQVAFTVAGNV